MFGAVFTKDDIGLDLHFLSRWERKLRSRSRRAGNEQQSTGLLHLDGFESIPYQKEKTIQKDGLFFLVDDIGLEPMTFRTSSGCSSQLS